MALIENRPDSTISWAESGNTLEPTTERREIGWVTERPPYEIMNWVLNNQDTKINYIYQEGFPAWDSIQEYSNTSFVKYNGIIYKAITNNTNKQPSTNPLVWEVAFASYSVAQDFQKVLDETNYADKLVYKDAPIMRSDCYGVGYSFTGSKTSGFYHNGTSPIVQRNGTTQAIFETPTNLLESSKKVVTMDVLQQFFGAMYDVGDLYLTTSTTTPTKRFGFGTWERYAEGRALVGYSPDVTTNTPDWCKIVNMKYGSYTHILTEDEMPSHVHPLSASYNITGEGIVNLNNGSTGAVTHTQPVGGGKEHNNVQPSIVIYVWIRVA